MGLDRARTFSARPARSEPDLEPKQEQVAGPGEPAGAVGHRGAEAGVLPVEENADMLIPVPTDSDIGGEDLVRPEVGVGQPGGEDLAAQAQRAVSESDFPSARAEAAGAR